MERIIPNYYHRFHCIASACPDSCCKEWSVDVDAASAAQYRVLEGPLGERLRQVLRDTEDGTVMEIENGRCPMWRTDGLCRIHTELGHDALCQVCRDFPRLRHDYGDYEELGLELSCPEAARLILCAEHDDVTSQEADSNEHCDDPQTLEILLRSRADALAFLESAVLPLPQTLAVMLLFGHSVQSELDGGDTAVLEPEALLEEAAVYAQAGNVHLIFGFLQNLEILTERWRDRLDSYAQTPVWPVEIRRFARYLIRRYWLQAISDYDLICRVKFIISACLTVAHLGGNMVDTAQQFSKEIENDPDNVEAFLDAAYTNEAFTDVHLLGLLLR